MCLSATSAAAQDKEQQLALGKAVFISSCQGCHELGDSKPVKWAYNPGPNLNDLFGRKPGSLPDYEYSEAMVEFGQDKLWDEVTLTTFFHDPGGVVPGTKMMNGVKMPEQLHGLLAYWRQINSLHYTCLPRSRGEQFQRYPRFGPNLFLITMRENVFRAIECDTRGNNECAARNLSDPPTAVGSALL